MGFLDIFQQLDVDWVYSRLFYWTLLRQWGQVYLPENWVLVKISGVFKKSGLNFWYFPWVLHFLCSKLILFLPEKWVLQPKFWVLRKKLAEFWNLSSFGQAEFLKNVQKKPALDPNFSLCFPISWVLQPKIFVFG